MTFIFGDQFSPFSERTKHNLTPEMGAVFLLPIPVVWGRYPAVTGGFPDGSHQKSLESAS